MMERRALFVGVNNYSDRDIHHLRFAVEDATDLAGFFKHCAKFNRAEVLTDPRNCDAVLERVHDMLYGLGPGDEFLFFFAGHGVTTHDGHRLVCSSDKLSAVKHSWAGLPLERLKLETAGSFNRLFLLDACRSDVLATNRGASCVMETGTRDLIMAGASSADEKDGVLTILCSCDDNECAGESAVLRHGLFSKAMLEMLDEEHREGRIVLVDDDFVYRRLPERMRLLAQESGMDFSQKPQKRGPAILLLDGIASPSRVQGVSPSVSSPAYVECPECGKHNLITETFRCKVCGRDNLCLSHFSSAHNSCMACANVALPKRRESAREMNGKGDDYYWGRNGVKQDYVEAIRWYRKAAEQGDAHAQFNLGWMYLLGHGVAQSDADAVTWYRKAAEQGDADAQINLGWMYQYGRGVAQSDADALLWYQKAADQGSEDAKQRLLKFRAQMSSSAVADEQTYYDVILKSFGSNKISVIATIREITGLGLADAKEMVECAPRLVRERVSKENAEDVAGQLRRVGAEVEVRHWGEPAMKKFVCPMCGYADVGQTAPKRCPQCGTPGPRFKDVDVAVE